MQRVVQGRCHGDLIGPVDLADGVNDEGGIGLPDKDDCCCERVRLKTITAHYDADNVHSARVPCGHAEGTGVNRQHEGPVAKTDTGGHIGREAGHHELGSAHLCDRLVVKGVHPAESDVEDIGVVLLKVVIREHDLVRDRVYLHEHRYGGITAAGLGGRDYHCVQLFHR